MLLRCQTFVVFLVLVTCEDYEDRLTKLWTYAGATKSDGSDVINVTSASIVIQPNSDVANEEIQRKQYFRPRAIPIRRDQQQLDKNVYYSQDNVKKYKSEILFPGNYIPIAKEKSGDDKSQFHPKPIPLYRSEQFQKRSMDADEEPTTDEDTETSEPDASRRSLSYILDDDDDDELEDEDGEYEVEEDVTGQDVSKSKLSKSKKPKLKSKKLKKYMLPLLLAYKMKYFALVPVMIGGLVLLVGATGLAGFFFALFAAVMGLQKGGY
ncbi:hypothetical protein K1T71_013640 [Dendrolimus kikuchii]|uniref:Uncharacterized protein n=1 Tax=Dendrolimus kikuchii TaxID=765133 RepID=A0ACC1CH05_9NEOP|nr:hypothetical protein K1T71_013640 [Dendrolimus kikuchii]